MHVESWRHLRRFKIHLAFAMVEKARSEKQKTQTVVTHFKGGPGPERSAHPGRVTAAGPDLTRPTLAPKVASHWVSKDYALYELALSSKP